MKLFKADLHMHTVLSPCGSLEMSPVAVVEKALEMKLDIIGVTDHNSTRQCYEVVKVAHKKGLHVLCGAEVTTKEEVHCLTFFENFEKLEIFQQYLDEHLPNVENNVEMFGHQVWVNEAEEILGEESRILISAINQTIEEVQAKVKQLGGLFIPAHVDRSRFSLYSQLGFMPSDLNPDAIGLSPNADDKEMVKKYSELANYTLLRSSDAHTLDCIGIRYTVFEMEAFSFDEVLMALHNMNGRKVYSCIS